MMEILNKISKTETQIIGQYSDGRDRQIIQVTTYEIKVYHDGKVYNLIFDHDPKDEEILAEFANTTASTIPEDIYIGQLKIVREEISSLSSKLDKATDDLSSVKNDLSTLKTSLTTIK